MEVEVESNVPETQQMTDFCWTNMCVFLRFFKSRDGWEELLKFNSQGFLGEDVVLF